MTPDFTARVRDDEGGPLDYYVGGAAREWAAAREEAATARAELLELVREAHRQGVSEYALAQAAGVQRSTIRAWLGK